MYTKEIEIIKKIINIQDTKPISFNDIGWTSRVYLIDQGKIVFKFPRDDKSRQGFQHEVDTLELIKQQSFHLNTPIIQWTNPNHDYIGFYGVDGNSMKQEEVSKLSEETRKEIGTSIGLFLKQLHSISYTKDPYIMTTKDEIQEYQGKYIKSIPTLKLYFNEKQLQILEYVFMKEMPDTMNQLGENLVFCHGDLGYNNILLSKNNKVGIIDFGDAGLYDQSKDFIGLEDKTIQEAAIIAYGDQQNLRDKIKIRQKVLPILDLLYYVGKKEQKGTDECIRLIRLIVE